MESAVTGTLDARPPVAMDAPSSPGAAGSALPRPSARRRPWVRPVLRSDPLATLGYPTDHPYVRRFWTAVMGPGAVADLLRLATAARRGGRLRCPVHLPSLAREGLVGYQEGRLWVRATVPPLSRDQVRRLPPWLRQEHGRWRWEGSAK